MPLSAIQNICTMVERDSEDVIIPYCVEHSIGFVPFSPIASGLLSGKITTKNKERILENLDAVLVELTDGEFTSIEAALDQREVYGHRVLGGF